MGHKLRGYKQPRDAHIKGAPQTFGVLGEGEVAEDQSMDYPESGHIDLAEMELRAVPMKPPGLNDPSTRKSTRRKDRARKKGGNVTKMPIQVGSRTQEKCKDKKARDMRATRQHLADMKQRRDARHAIGDEQVLQCMSPEDAWGHAMLQNERGMTEIG